MTGHTGISGGAVNTAPCAWEGFSLQRGDGEVCVCVRACVYVCVNHTGTPSDVNASL